MTLRSEAPMAKMWDITSKGGSFHNAYVAQLESKEWCSGKCRIFKRIHHCTFGWTPRIITQVTNKD